MSKLDELIGRYHQFFIKKLGRNDVDEFLLRQIALSLGPSIYNNDGSKVACTDSTELSRIKSSFLMETLGMKNDPSLDKAIKEVCNTMGSATRNKYRVVFYYLLVEKFEKQEYYQARSETLKAQNEVEKNKEKSSKSDKPKKSGPKKSPSSENENIHHYALYAAGAGLIPIPIIDLASISAIQYAMIKKIASNYPHVKFDETKTKSLIMALLGGAGSFQLGTITRWLTRGIPLIGPIIGGTAMSGFAYLSTKLIGNIFTDHFESGGDLAVEDITFQKMKESFQKGLNRK